MRRAGFTLLEAVIVASIIGLLAVLAIPTFTKARLRSQNATFINDLRVTGEAFEQYAMEKGDFPPDAPADVVPEGMAEYMPQRIHWETGPRIGGRWDWDRAPEKGGEIFGCCYAGISVLEPRRTSVQMSDIDAIIDDGDLSSGSFRAREGGYIYILQKD
jgi:prepilin-type N-terminal cleavage/methylation domain-containing protein